jgi:negative regulator of sigma E activity
MTEQIQDQISAFADDELSAEECEFLVRRMERDSEFRQKALSYATIGAALRGEILHPDPDILRRRVQQELGAVSVPVREGLEHTAVVNRRFARPVLGLGIAASVAVVALLVLSSLNQPGVPDNPAAGLTAAGLTAAGLTAADVSIVPTSETASYVVPQEVSTNAQLVHQPLAAPIRLTNYLVTHGEYVQGFGRTSIHTDVVGNRGTFVVVSTESEQE